MREILFRGKREDNGEWIEGFYINIAKANSFIATGKLTIDSINKNALIPEMYHVIPETIGQYTGLTDKNGKKIFEGDIVHAVYQSNYTGIPNTDFGIGIVEYDDSYYGGASYQINIINEIGARIFSASLKGGVTVIGNIYDNPELLKKERELNA